MSFADSLESLKDFDINDLDFNNAGSWPLLVRLITFFLAFALILGGGYWFLIQDQFQTLTDAKQKEATLKAQYEQKAYKVANLAAYKLQMTEMKQSFGALLKQLPTDTEVPGLLEDITNTGLGNGLEIKSIKLQPVISKGFYAELPMDIVVAGGFHEIASFVSGVASLPRIVTLHNFSITPSKKDGVLDMNIVAKTYRYNAGGK